jgi:aryl-alcohol dehydrogenase-like predicted oxidoreductase
VNIRCGRAGRRTGVLQACEELGIGFVPYRPLGKGFLTGSMNENTKLASNDFRSILPRFTPEAMKANRALVDLLGRIAKKKNATSPISSCRSLIKLAADRTCCGTRASQTI